MGKISYIKTNEIVFFSPRTPNTEEMPNSFTAPFLAKIAIYEAEMAEELSKRLKYKHSTRVEYKKLSGKGNWYLVSLILFVILLIGLTL